MYRICSVVPVNVLPTSLFSFSEKETFFLTPEQIEQISRKMAKKLLQRIGASNALKFTVEVLLLQGKKLPDSLTETEISFFSEKEAVLFLHHAVDAFKEQLTQIFSLKERLSNSEMIFEISENGPSELIKDIANRANIEITRPHLPFQYRMCLRVHLSDKKAILELREGNDRGFLKSEWISPQDL